MSLIHLVWLFFAYSFLGWVAETSVAAARQHRYVDRSVLFGPLCIVYGAAGVLITVGLQELSHNWFFLFLGSALLASVVEWVAGHLLEKFTGTRWWDYSKFHFNLDGYICLGSAVVWGVVGVVCVKWINGLLIGLFDLLPQLAGEIALWVLLGLLALDAIATALTLGGVLHKLPPVAAVGNSLAAVSVRMGNWILGHSERRIQKAHPQAKFVREKAVRSDVFAAGCGFYKVVMLFFIGAFLGDIAETLFCRVTAGVWMSRSSVVWGPFSIVWGLAMALCTLLLYRYKDKSASFLFVAGTLLGGAYEYLCSVFTELVFGTVFWDYSHVPFNLGGRINLLYCFFWGFAAVAWFRLVYPALSKGIEHLPKTFGKILTWVLLLFILADGAVSAAALSRYDQRAGGDAPANAVEAYIDQHFDDDRMREIYPNAVRPE